MKLNGLANALTGIVFLIMGIGLMWVLVEVGQLFAEVSALGIPGVEEALGPIGFYMSLGWVFSVITLLAGIVNLAAGGAMLLSKKK